MPDLPFFAALTIFGQRADAADIAVVLLLVVLEGVLSIDNALVLGLLAKRLPPERRKQALTYGLIGAFVFRVVAICTASLLLQWTFVKFLGGAYLVYIALQHILFGGGEHEEKKIELDAQGNPILHDEKDVEAPEGSAERAAKHLKIARAARHFWYTVAVIELTDVAFAVDSILAAMALAGSRQDKLWVVITGGIIGVILMRFAAVVFIRLLEKFPRFELAAYLLVLIIGSKLLADWGANSDWSFQQTPQIAKALGSWQPKFVAFEQNRRDTVHSYEQWLHDDWIFHLKPKEHHEPEPPEPAPELEPPQGEGPGQVKLPPHVPHLLDFHDLRRPECIAFWLTMIACFSIGFIKPKKHPEKPPATPEQPATT
jgi:YkoY family integral membrane protein